MADITVYNTEGNQVDTIKVDESVFGGMIRYRLLKQALVMYHANKRVGTAATKSRSTTAGSGRKLFRQKGTGFARAGTRRTGKRVGGGMTFAKQARDFRKAMPRKQKKMARDSAILAKLKTDDIIVVDGLKFESPRTKDFAKVLGNLGIDRSCLVTTAEKNSNLYLSARNIPKIAVCTVTDLNAGDLCNHRKAMFTRQAFMSLLPPSSENAQSQEASA